MSGKSPVWLQAVLIISNRYVATQKGFGHVRLMKDMENFCHEGKPSYTTTKSTPFAISKDEWDKKEDTGKFHEECIVCTAVC